MTTNSTYIFSNSTKEVVQKEVKVPPDIFVNPNVATPLYQQIKEYCDGRGTPCSHFALAWCLANPILTSVVIGPRTMEQFDDELPHRKFDNFQFVEFNSVFHKYPAERREFVREIPRRPGTGGGRSA